MRQGQLIVELRDRSELQLEAQRMTNDITLESKSSAKETTELELKVVVARLDIAGTLEIMPQSKKGCKLRPKLWEIDML